MLGLVFVIYIMSLTNYIALLPRMTLSNAKTVFMKNVKIFLQKITVQTRLNLGGIFPVFPLSANIYQMKDSDSVPEEFQSRVMTTT